MIRTYSWGEPKPGAPTLALALSLYRELARDPANLIFSPYSIASALVMLLAGSSGATRTEIEGAFGRVGAGDVLLEGFRKIGNQLGERRGLELVIANGLWCQEGYALEPEYVESITRALALQIASVDFAKAPREAADVVNAWARESTRQKIDAILSPSHLSPLTRVVLASAVYFRGDWGFPFVPPLTRAEPFHLHDGSEVDVPTMHVRAHFQYARSKDFQLLHLPYGADDARMLLLVPEPGGLEALERSLDADKLDQAVGAMKLTEIVLSMPRFRFRSLFPLRGALERVGVTDAFQPRVADFSRISSEPGFAVSEALHSALIDVTESGTEAAAVTAVALTGASSTWRPPEPIVVRVDRPFAFLIYDDPTGAVLFAGRVLDPRAG